MQKVYLLLLSVRSTKVYQILNLGINHFLLDTIHYIIFKLLESLHLICSTMVFVNLQYIYTRVMKIHKRILNQNKTVHETNTKLIQIHRIVINTC